MDELSLESQEIKTMAKKVYIAELKIDKIMEEARNYREQPSEIVELT